MPYNITTPQKLFFFTDYFTSIFFQINNEPEKFNFSSKPQQVYDLDDDCAQYLKKKRVKITIHEINTHN